ncbi:MAG: hypothetical protein A2V70_07950 [Planctomycetes bacterium RBG_13_63_9]|nr:MAG: hypothetical protein A2V70_07950 [Planctomycetes bacterium RBG_13_63_9]
MTQSEPSVRVELLGVLAARNARETLPTVVDATKDPDTTVRLAALGALRFLAEADHAATIIAALTAAKNDAERRKAELALLAVSSRGGPKCADAVMAGLAEADAPSRIALLHALARAGGEKALAEIVARLQDDDQTVRDEAVRTLSIWPDPAASEHLLAIAKTAQNPRHQVLAIRGLVRLASPQEDQPANLQTLGEAMSLAKRPQEKRLVLGVLGAVGTSQALASATPALDDPTLAEEAALASVMIAEKIKDGDRNTIRPAMEKVLKTTKSPQLRKRAEKLLKSP